MVSVKRVEEKLNSISLEAKGAINKPGVLAKLTKIFASSNVNVYGGGCGEDSVTFYVGSSDMKSLMPVLEAETKKIGFPDFDTRDDVGLIIVKLRRDTWYSLGILGQITGALSDSGVSIVDISTSEPDILIFINFADLQKAERILQGIYKNF